MPTITRLLNAECAEGAAGLGNCRQALPALSVHAEDLLICSSVAVENARQ